MIEHLKYVNHFVRSLSNEDPVLRHAQLLGLGVDQRSQELEVGLALPDRAQSSAHDALQLERLLPC